MIWKEIAKKNEGFHTVESFSKSMGIKRETAINYLYFMRKKGFVETKRGKKGKRLYEIMPLKLKKIGHPGLYETINRYSSLKLTMPIEERSDHKITPEEAVVRAILTRDFRVVLASLELFKKTKDWWLLYNFSKKCGVERFVGALYSLSRKLFKVRSIDKRVLGLLKKSRIRERYIIPRARSSDFKEIEKEWKVYIPFSKSDVQRLKG